MFRRRMYRNEEELHTDLFCRHASPLEVYVFVAVANRGGRCYVRRDLSSTQWKAAIKEAEWPKSAAPRLVYDSALFFETCMHVYVRTRYYVRPNMFGENKKHTPEVRSRDGLTCRTCVAWRTTLKSRRPPSLAAVQIYLLCVCCKPWMNIKCFEVLVYGYFCSDKFWVEENRIIRAKRVSNCYIQKKKSVRVFD